MDMAFAQSGRRDAHKLRPRLKLFNRCSTDVAHGCAQTAPELMQDRADRAAIRHLSFYAFRYEFQTVLDVLLEISVGRAARHGPDRSHATIGFVRAPLVKKDLARA